LPVHLLLDRGVERFVQADQILRIVGGRERAFTARFNRSDVAERCQSAERVGINRGVNGFRRRATTGDEVFQPGLHHTQSLRIPRRQVVKLVRIVPEIVQLGNRQVDVLPSAGGYSD
jgi:hypothetical protein